MLIWQVERLAINIDVLRLVAFAILIIIDYYSDYPTEISQIIQTTLIFKILFTLLSVYRLWFWMSLSNGALSFQLPISTLNTPSTVVFSSTIVRMDSPAHTVTHHTQAKDLYQSSALWIVLMQ